MAKFLINKLIYKGDNYQFESPEFSRGLNVIAGGENGVGKTTFADLIYFCLGGNVEQFKSDVKEPHIEITSDKNAVCMLNIELAGVSYEIHRYIGYNEIAVKNEGGEVTIMPVFRSNNAKTFSDWFLSKLGFEPIKYHASSTLSFYLGITDFFRLIYFNQSADSEIVLKQPDTHSRFGESLKLRKIIFETLNGHSFRDLQTQIGKFKMLEAIKNEKEAAVKSTSSLIYRFSKNPGSTAELKERRGQLQAQLELLLSKKKTGSKINIEDPSAHVILKIEELNEKLTQIETLLAAEKKNHKTIEAELFDINQSSSIVKGQVEAVNRILYTSEQLKLFTPDTCPICLAKKEVVFGQCICGSSLKEGEYQRYFYTNDEYLQIAKSKSKTIGTLNDALEQAKSEIQMSRDKIFEYEKQVEATSNNISKILSETVLFVDTSNLDDLMEQIFFVRSELESIDRQLILTEELEDDEASLLSATVDFKRARDSVNQLEINIEQETKVLRDTISSYYSDYILKTNSKIGSAYIDSDYEPHLGQGYQPNSFHVHRRLLYYLAVFKYCLNNRNIPNPAFLLIDTPNTAGINVDNLDKCLSQLLDFTKYKSVEWQILLTSDDEDIPIELQPFIKMKIPKGTYLLQAREK